jgi:hypothetical protein
MRANGFYKVRLGDNWMTAEYRWGIWYKDNEMYGENYWDEIGEEV